jgi:hypothetical protein
VRVSWLSHKTKVAGLSVVWPQNYWDGFLRFGSITGGGFFGLASKPVVTVFSGLASKLVAWVSRFGPQNQYLRFGDLASKSPRQFLGLSLKIKHASVCQLRNKTDGRMQRRGSHIEI